MKKPCDHPELFRLRPTGKPKSHRQLAYWNLPTNPVVEFSDGELLCIKREGPGLEGNPRLYANVPGHGKVQGRNFKAVLAQLALIDQIRALNTSIQVKLKQQDDAARILSDLTRDSSADLAKENARLLAEVEAEKKKSARLRDELEALRRRRPELPPSERAQSDKAENFQSAVLILRPPLEKILGPKRAIVLHQLHWLLKQEGNGAVLADGRKYIYNTYPQWKSAYFPNWSIPTIKRHFQSLEKAGLVDSKQPEGRSSRRKYYTLSAEGIKLIPSALTKGSNCADGMDQSDPLGRSKRSLPINTKNTSSNNTSKEAAAAAAAGEVTKRTKDDDGDDQLENDNEWLQALADKQGWSAKFIGIEFKKFEKWAKGVSKTPSRRIFEDSWIPKIEKAAKPSIERPREIPKADQVDLPAYFKSWLAARWPEHREAAESWKTWADVPNEVIRDRFGETKLPFIAAREISK